MCIGILASRVVSVLSFCCNTPSRTIFLCTAWTRTAVNRAGPVMCEQVPSAARIPAACCRTVCRTAVVCGCPSVYNTYTEMLVLYCFVSRTVGLKER
jgi:hypothetical protein